MPNVKGPLFSLTAQGTLARVLTYQGGRKQSRVIKCPTPTYTRTEDQLRMRSVFTQGLEFWELMTYAQKAKWKAYYDEERNHGRDAFMRVLMRRVLYQGKRVVGINKRPGFWDAFGDAGFGFLFDGESDAEFWSHGPWWLEAVRASGTRRTRAWPQYKGVNISVDADCFTTGALAVPETMKFTFVVDVVLDSWRTVNSHVRFKWGEWTEGHLWMWTTYLGAVRVYVRTEEESILLTGPVQEPGKWARIGVTLWDEDVRLYVNGKQVDVCELDGSLGPMAEEMEVGGLGDVGSREDIMDGAIDRVLFVDDFVPALCGV